MPGIFITVGHRLALDSVSLRFWHHQSMIEKKKKKTRSILANDRAIMWARAKVCVHADSVLCVGQVKDIRTTMERPSWRSRDVFVLPRCSENRRRSDWIRVEKIPRIFVIVYSWRDPERRREKEHPARGVQGPDHPHVNVQWHWVENEWWELHFECRESQELRDEILARTLDVSGSRVAREMVWRILTIEKENGILQPKKWYSDSNELVILCSKVSVPWVVGSWSRRRVKRPYTSMEIQHTQQLLFQTVHSVNQLSSHGAVAKWCHQFCLTEEGKGRVTLSMDNKMLTSVPPEDVQLLVSHPTLAPENRMRENVLSFEALSSRIQLTQLCGKAYFQYRETAGKKNKKIDLTGTTVGELSLLHAGNTHFPDLLLNSKWQPFPKAQSLDQFWKFASWKFLMNMG